MPTFAGETIRVTVLAKDYDAETVLIESDVSSANITIYDTDDSIIGTYAMTYHGDHGYWYYDWDSDGQLAGDYRFKTQLSGALWESWEYGKIRLKANPV